MIIWQQSFTIVLEFGIIDRIIIYCEKDTIAVAQIFLRLRGDAILSDDEILHIYKKVQI